MTSDLSWLVRSLDARLNASAKWHSLSPDGKSWLVERLLSGKLTLQQLSDELAQRYSVRYLTSSLSQLGAVVCKLDTVANERREIQDTLAARLAGAGRTAEAIEQLAAGAADTAIAATAKLLGDHVLEILARPNLDPETLIPLVQSFLATAGEHRKHAEAALDRERFQRETCALFIKWSADQRAHQIASDAALTHETKIAALQSYLFAETSEPPPQSRSSCPMTMGPASTLPAPSTSP